MALTGFILAAMIVGKVKKRAEIETTKILSETSQPKSQAIGTVFT